MSAQPEMKFVPNMEMIHMVAKLEKYDHLTSNNCVHITDPLALNHVIIAFDCILLFMNTISFLKQMFST